MLLSSVVYHWIRSESQLRCNWRSVDQSVSQSVNLGVQPLRDLWRDSGCGEDSCFFSV